VNRFFTLDEINPKLKLLSHRYEQIKKEFNDNLDKFVWTNWRGNNQYTSIKNSPYDGWKVCALMSDAEGISSNQINSICNQLSLSFNQRISFNEDKQIFLTENSCYLPTLISTLIECDVKKRVGISVVFPGKNIKWHMDPDPEKEDYALIRGLWGVDIKSEESGVSFLCLGDEINYEKRQFRNNEFMFFWGRTKHMVANTLQTPRYVLLFDQEVSRDYLLRL
jgi:hypothetical protein